MRTFLFIYLKNLSFLITKLVYVICMMHNFFDTNTPKQGKKVFKSLNQIFNQLKRFWKSFAMNANFFFIVYRMLI